MKLFTQPAKIYLLLIALQLHPTPHRVNIYLMQPQNLISIRFISAIPALGFLLTVSLLPASLLRPART
jgi:hypothetical protein